MSTLDYPMSGPFSRIFAAFSRTPNLTSTLFLWHLWCQIIYMWLYIQVWLGYKFWSYPRVYSIYSFCTCKKLWQCGILSYIFLVFPKICQAKGVKHNFSEFWWKLRAYSVTELSLIKSWFDEGQFGLQGTTQCDWVGEACHVLRNFPVFCHVAKTPSASFNAVGPKLAGHNNLNYKVFIIEQVWGKIIYEY